LAGRPRIDLEAKGAGAVVDGEQEVGSTEQVVGGRIDTILVGGNHAPVDVAGSRAQPDRCSGP